MTAETAPEPLDPTIPFRLKPGEIIRTLRERKGKTLEQLAKETGVSANSLSAYERGIVPSGPSARTIIRLAAYFGVSTDFLLGLTDIPTRAERKGKAQIPKSTPKYVQPQLDTASIEDVRTPGRVRPASPAVRDVRRAS